MERARSLRGQGALGGLSAAHAEVEVGLTWAMPGQSGDGDQALAFHLVRKSAMGVGRAPWKRGRPAPRAGLESSSTTLEPHCASVSPYVIEDTCGAHKVVVGLNDLLYKEVIRVPGTY